MISKTTFVRFIIPAITALFVLLLLKYNDADSPEISTGLFQESFGPVMGTSGNVKILPTDKLKVSAQDAFAYAYNKTKQAEALLSRFNPESDISKINSAAAGVKIKVDPLTWRTLLESRRFHQLTDGAFDPAIGQLIAVYPWKEKEISALPAPAVINEALSHSGFDKIVFTREGMLISKTDSSVILDLGGIAKGLGVSIMAESLKEQGVESAIIEIGGEIEIIGSPAINDKVSQMIGEDQKIWTARIKNPRGNNYIKSLASHKGGVSIATSGDYEKYFKVGDKRYSHIIDPVTGYPASGGIISATIVTTRSCTIADALATSVSVIGVDRAKELLKLFPDTNAYLIMSDMSEVTIEGGLLDKNTIEEISK